MTLKKNQHYVPKFYLKEWINPNFYVLFKSKRNIEKRNIKTIASQKYFYELQRISEFEINVLKIIFEFDKQPEIIRQTDLTFIKNHNDVFDIIDNLHKKIKNKNKLRKIENLLLKNIDEEYHSNIENSLRHRIEDIRNGDFSFLNDPYKVANFEYDVAQQYVRTKKIKEEFINTFENIQNTDSNNNLININALWNIIIKIMANRLSYYLRVKLNKKINIIINNTQFPFITGDQPIINLDYNTNKIVYENWYYPISRNLGIIYTDKNINEYFLDSSNLTVDEVKILNNHIYNNALEQVYSDKVSVLESYI